MQHLDQRILDYEKKNYSYLNKGLQWLSSKESSCNAGDPEFNPWVGKIPWRMAWQPTLVFLPGEPHGLWSLVGYSPWGRKELDTTERHNLT